MFYGIFLIFSLNFGFFKTFSVIADYKTEVVDPVHDFYFDLCRIGMPGDIAQRFLQNPNKMCFLRFFKGYYFLTCNVKIRFYSEIRFKRNANLTHDFFKIFRKLNTSGTDHITDFVQRLICIELRF